MTIGVPCLYYFVGYSWYGSSPDSGVKQRGWAEKDGVVISEAVKYYRTVGHMIMDEHMNFIRDEPYCGIMDTLSAGIIEVFDFDGQTIRLTNKCYGPSDIRVFSPVSDKGKKYLQTMLLNGNTITLKRAVPPGSSGYIPSFMRGNDHIPPPPLFTSKGYSEAMRYKTPKGQAELKGKQAALNKEALKRQLEANQRWKKLEDNAL